MCLESLSNSNLHYQKKERACMMRCWFKLPCAKQELNVEGLLRCVCLSKLLAFFGSVVSQHLVEPYVSIPPLMCSAPCLSALNSLSQNRTIGAYTSHNSFGIPQALHVKYQRSKWREVMRNPVESQLYDDF